MMSSKSVRILSFLIVMAFLMNCVNYLYCTLYYRDMSKPVPFPFLTEVTYDESLQKLRKQPTGLLGRIYDRPKILISSQTRTTSSQSSSSDYDTTTDPLTTLSVISIRTTVRSEEQSETSEVNSALGSPPESISKIRI